MWHAGLLHKLKSYGILGHIWPYFLYTSSGSGREVLQEYPVIAGVPQGFMLGPTPFLLYINDPPDDVICNIAIYADDTTLYS